MQKRIPAVFAALLASCIVSTTGQSQSSDPWIGTWKVNLEKSTFSPGPKPTTAVTVKMESPAGGIKITIDGTTSDGKPLHTEVVGAFDGKDNPIKGIDLPMTAAYKRIDGRTFESMSKMDGKPTTTNQGCDIGRWQNDDRHHHGQRRRRENRQQRHRGGQTVTPTAEAAPSSGRWVGAARADAARGAAIHNVRVVVMQSRSTYSSRLHFLETGRVDILRRLKGFGRRHLSLPLRLALREVAAEYRLQRLHRAGVRKARRMHWDAPLKLNLGCDANLKAGWVNIDLFTATADIRLDLREPLPFADNSAAFIYSEHVFEHLAYPCVHDAMGWTVETPGAPSEAMQLLRESRRVLMPGGVFSVGVPDAERAVAQYARREFERWGPPWVDTPMHFLNYVFRQGREHKYAYRRRDARPPPRDCGLRRRQAARLRLATRFRPPDERHPVHGSAQTRRPARLTKLTREPTSASRFRARAARASHSRLEGAQVDLVRGRPRQCVDDHERVRHHVGRQKLQRRFLESDAVQRRTGSQADESHNPHAG